MLLQFYNSPDPSSSPTWISYAPKDDGDKDAGAAAAGCQVRIHRLGDLTAGENEILHSLPLELFSAGSVTLDRRLVLGVGGDGIIGRSVSVVRGGVVVGGGIIGWN